MSFKERSPFFIVFGIIFLALAVQGCVPSFCGVTTYTVSKFNDTNDGVCDADCSLREAVINSNVCAGTQTIDIPAGIYDLSIAGTGEDAAATGDLDLTDDAILMGLGAPFIDANGIDRVFEIHNTATVEIHTMLIRGGEAQQGAGIRNYGRLTMVGGVVANNTGVMGDEMVGTHSGGGIWSNGTLVLHGTQVRENAALQGGGILISSPGTLDMNNAMITGNTADWTGGGLEIGTGTIVTLTAVDVWRNESTNTGGGIWNGGTLNLNQSAIYENIAGMDGGGLLNGASGVVWGTEVRIEDNEARQGGGIHTTSHVTLYQSSLTNNRATSGAGGGVFIDSAFPGLHMQNGTVSGNTASLAGSAGGIHNDASDIWLEWVTIAENSPMGLVNTPGSMIMIDNSIVAYNAAGNCIGVGMGSGGYNVEDGISCNFTAADDMSSTDPMLDVLANNGGFSPTHALLPGSPAIDSATPDMCIPIDQRGLSRPQGPQCDRGAVEMEVSSSIPIVIDTPTPVPTSTPTPEPIPISINFNADLYLLQEGECTKLHWLVENADDVFLDGDWVDALGTRQVCPEMTTTYVLLVLSDAGEEEAFVNIEVEILPEPPDAPAQLHVEDWICNAKVYQVTLEWIDVADNEAGYKVFRDGVLLATLPANATSYVDKPPYGGAYTYEVTAFNDGGASSKASMIVKSCNYELQIG